MFCRRCDEPTQHPDPAACIAALRDRLAAQQTRATTAQKEAGQLALELGAARARITALEEEANRRLAAQAPPVEPRR